MVDGGDDVNPICVIDDCQQRATRKGMCQLHYRRSKVHGDPHKTNRRAPADGKGYHNIDGKGEHVRIAERAIGKPLPKGAQVHHVNFDRSDNAPSNLVVCPSARYHQLLHIRTRALDATGNANARLCMFCREYDVPENLSGTTENRMYHAACNRSHVAAYAVRRSVNVVPI